MSTFEKKIIQEEQIFALENFLKSLDITNMNHKQLCTLLMIGQKLVLMTENHIKDLEKIKII